MDTFFFNTVSHFILITTHLRDENTKEQLNVCLGHSSVMRPYIHKDHRDIVLFMDAYACGHACVYV